MTWDFTTEPEFQAGLDWADRFVRDDDEPLTLVLPGRRCEIPSARVRSVIDALKQRVREEGLWAAHLGPELGGKGFGQLKADLTQRDTRPLRMGSGDLRDDGARHRQCRDPRPLRHRRAEGHPSATAAGRWDLLVVFDDRAPRRMGPHAGCHSRSSLRGWVLNGEKFFSVVAR